MNQTNNISGEDRFIINSLMTVIRKLLCLEKITPQQIIALGTALYALEILPRIIDVFIECEISTTNRDENGFGHTTIWSIAITGSSISVNSDGIEHSPYGSDSYRRFSWNFSNNEGSYSFPDDNFNEWLNEVNELFDCEFKLYINNESAPIPRK